MSSFFPNKTIFSISTAYEAAKSITALTNANPAAASSVANGYTDGNILLAASGWNELNDRPVRVAGKTTDAFNYEGFDTTNTSRFPAGAGVGSTQKVSTWAALSQVTDSQSSGGEQQYYQWVYLEDGLQRQRPTFKNARALQLTLDYDDSLAWYSALLAADLAGDTRILRAALPNGKFFYWSVVVGFDGEPSMTINQNMAVVATFSLQNPRSTKY